MKRFVLLLLCILLLPLYALGEETPEAQYEAISNIEFHLRPEPESTYFIAEIPSNVTLKVYVLGDEWSLVSYRKDMGWCKTRWLWGYRSLDAAKYPVPNANPACGMLTTKDSLFISSGDFKGLTVSPGTIVCATAVQDDSYTLPVWRQETVLSADLFQYDPFVPWQDAQPGDLIAGYTTYYNERTGGALADSRAYNIALGCERINGTCVEPGGTFSFNALCGPYKQYNGYQMAPNISNSGKGFGGGVCQVTTTLYNALLGVPIQITDWSVHRYIGVQYIPQFFDAAVGSYSDLQFENTLPYPVLIEAMPQNGAVTVLLSRAE